MESDKKAYIASIVSKLLKRYDEIRDVFKPVTQYIKRMEKEAVDEEGEIFLEVVNNFVSGELPAEMFVRIWKDMGNKESSKHKDSPNYDALTARLSRGEIIPFIGSDVFHHTVPPMLSTEELVQQLAMLASYHSFPGTLSVIAQYYQMSEHGRETLVRNLLIKDQSECVISEANPFYVALSNVRVPMIIISVCYENSLEKAFQENQKKYVVISHHNHSSSEFGKLLIRYSDKENPEPPCTAEAVSGLNLLEKGYSVIYKVCGCLSLCCDNITEKTDPLFISEEDFFNFSRYLEKMIPDYLVRQFSRRSFLFLGYNPAEWHDRLIINAILEKRRGQRERSYAIREIPQNYEKFEKAFWKFNGVDIYEVRTEIFVRELCERMTKSNGEIAMKPNFDVFLCHNSADKSVVKEIANKLKKKGISVWLDEWELRPGLPWQDALSEQIKSIKSAAVFVGESGLGPWQDLEQKAFIQQFRNRKCPVIPVILKECDKEPELPPLLDIMHKVDFRKAVPDPMEQLIWGITGKRG